MSEIDITLRRSASPENLLGEFPAMPLNKQQHMPALLNVVDFLEINEEIRIVNI